MGLVGRFPRAAFLLRTLRSLTPGPAEVFVFDKNQKNRTVVAIMGARSGPRALSRLLWRIGGPRNRGYTYRTGSFREDRYERTSSLFRVFTLQRQSQAVSGGRLCGLRRERGVPGSSEPGFGRARRRQSADSHHLFVAR